MEREFFVHSLTRNDCVSPSNIVSTELDESLLLRVFQEKFVRSFFSVTGTQRENFAPCDNSNGLKSLLNFICCRKCSIQQTAYVSVYFLEKTKFNRVLIDRHRQ